MLSLLNVESDIKLRFMAELKNTSECCVCFSARAARPKESQDFQAAAASHPKSCESDHNDGGVGGIPL